MTDLIAQISAVVDPGAIIIGDEVAARPQDWTGIGSCPAQAIIRPKDTQQLSDVMKICHAAGQTVVPQGGLTGLVHGGDAKDGDIVISFERMTQVESIDPIGRTMTVQAGTPLQKAQEAADEAELLYPVDLGARGTATIGGTISTNAGGNQVIRYGMTRENILGLEAVLADGTIVSSMNRLLKNNAGYDLKHLFIGSEGTLGFVTRAVLRLRSRPISENTALLALSDFDSVSRFFDRMGRFLAGSLTAFEVLWAEHYELLTTETNRHQPPLPAEYPYYVILEANGSDQVRDDALFEEILGKALEDELIVDAVIASSKSQRQAIWDIREDISGLAETLKPWAIFDVSMPISEMEEYISKIDRALTNRWNDKYRLIVFGHLGDSNLHILVSPHDWDDESQAAAEEDVYTPLAGIGGSISAEHGIGLEKRAWLKLSRTPEELSLMRTMKQALDSKNILNPDKIWVHDMPA